MKKDNAEKIYEDIVNKLGFDPRHETFDYPAYECDIYENPFESLTVDETKFLYKYLQHNP